MITFTQTLIIFFLGMGVSMWHLSVLLRGNAYWKNRDPHDPNSDFG